MKLASIGGYSHSLVFYDESDLKARMLVVELFRHQLFEGLTSLNRAFRFYQVETPILTPKNFMVGHLATGFDLVKASFQRQTNLEAFLRPETTAGTFAAFDSMWPQVTERKKQLPIVIWQYGKAFRDEQTRPFAELRFLEFYQLEFQLFYSNDTKADYFSRCLELSTNCIRNLTGNCTLEEDIPKEDLAHYSTKTVDMFSSEIEVAAISKRIDYPDCPVIEISVGLDRLTALQKVYKKCHD